MKCLPGLPTYIYLARCVPFEFLKHAFYTKYTYLDFTSQSLNFNLWYMHLWVLLLHYLDFKTRLLKFNSCYRMCVWVWVCERVCVCEWVCGGNTLSAVCRVDLPHQSWRVWPRILHQSSGLILREPLRFLHQLEGVGLRLWFTFFPWPLVRLGSATGTFSLSVVTGMIHHHRHRGHGISFT